MKTARHAITSSAALLILLASALGAKVGEAAPDFAASDSHGATQQLSAYKGKFVVLEWHNQGCPYTRKHYESGNMQRLQKQWTQKGVVWLTVVSSSPGAQGYVTPAEENEYIKKTGSAPTAALLDPQGTVGHLYGARTTPHMFIIDPYGKLVYNGAIDDRPTTEQADIAGAKNYVSEALQAAMAGRQPPNPTTRPYGCSVKYAD